MLEDVFFKNVVLEIELLELVINCLDLILFKVRNLSHVVIIELELSLLFPVVDSIGLRLNFRNLVKVNVHLFFL